ncbi:major histocompatibility complex class I-related gene protein-like [Erythrolamprus reginae]|uniref:major histocompatibility complex class I-related gene protein-like n=1 Tax=Erythrolamprus reginae TaxID=121349 RepID=UPI00396CDB80
MALRSAPFRLLVLLAVALRDSCDGASSHSMKYFFTSISEPSQGLPHFVIVGFVDGQAIDHYDSNSRRTKPRVSWMEKVGKEDPQYWDSQTQRARANEEIFRGNLEILRNRYNQSEGLHTVQRMYGCELRSDGKKGGFYQDGYEGRTFITFDKETLTWVAPDPQAQITQRKWDADPGWNQYLKVYLEKECFDWIKKYLSYGNETLLRTGGSLPALHMMVHFPPPPLEGSTSTIKKALSVSQLGVRFPLISLPLKIGVVSLGKRPGAASDSGEQKRMQKSLEGLRVNSSVSAEPPVVTMSSRTEVEDGIETHVCRVHGFYPREIDASWTRDGEVWLQDTFHGFLAPNKDGTYHYWISIQIDPKERGRYRCRVEHDGLQDRLDLELKEPTDSKSNLGLIIIGCVVAALVVRDVRMATEQQQPGCSWEWSPQGETSGRRNLQEGEKIQLVEGPSD